MQPPTGYASLVNFRGLLILVGVVAFIVLPNLVDFFIEWLWFGASGYRGVYVTSLRAQASLFTLILGFAFVVLYGNLWIAVSSIASPYIVIGTGGAGTVQPAMIRREQIRKMVGIGSLVVSLMIGLAGSSEWMRWLQFRNGVPFGVADPILGHDIGFYVFRLPLFDLLQQIGVAVVVVALIGSAAAYVLAGALNFTKRGGVSVVRKARLHLSLLAAAFFLLLAASAYLEVPHLLTDVTGPGIVPGASYTDVMARMPAARVLMVVALLSAGLAAYHAFSTAVWPVPLAIGLYLLTSIGGSLYAAGIQRFVVTPNEQAAETPYMTHNIAATRQAFNLAAVRTRNFSGDAALTRDDIDRNADTLKNVRLWDHQPLLETFGQIQELRTYYDFASVDNDRYTINGELRQVMLSARELNSESLPNRTWINEHLTFTHGYGITLGPVNEVTPEGLPILFVKDIPPQSSVPASIDVKEPSIYFGELTNNYVLVNTNAKEFHYSKAEGEENVETVYSGADGVRIGGLGTPAALQRRLPVAADSVQQRHHRRQPRALSPEHHRSRHHDRAVPAIRRRPVSRRVRRRPAVLDSRRVHDHVAISLFRAVCRRPQLHPELGQGDHRRLQRHDRVLRVGPARSARADARTRVSRPAAAARCHARRPAAASPLSGDDLRDSGRDVLDLSHDQPGGLLQQGRSVGDSGGRHRRQPAADAAVLHDHAAARGGALRVHSDAAVHARAEGQPGRVDGRALRSGALRAARGLRVSAADDRVRAAPDHRAHQPGPGDLAADHAVEPAGLAGDSGHAARHSGRRSAAVRAAAVPARIRRQNSGAEPRHRRL